MSLRSGVKDSLYFNATLLTGYQFLQAQLHNPDVAVGAPGRVASSIPHNPHKTHADK